MSRNKDIKKADKLFHVEHTTEKEENMTHFKEKMCADCVEKCRFFFRSMNDGNVPFGCSQQDTHKEEA